MPTWTHEYVQPPWSKPHTVSLLDPEVYDRAAANKGSDNITRHAPLSLANGTGRKAGTSGAFTEQNTTSMDATSATDVQPNECKSSEYWKQAFKDASYTVNVRQVKSGTFE